MSSQASQNYYNFFDDMNKNCVYKAVINVNNGTSLVLPTAFKTIMDCESSSLNASEKKVCNMFNNLINTICSINSSSETNRNLNDGDYIYQELWIILALKREGITGNASLGDISHSIKDVIEGCFSKDLLKYILEDIDDHYLEKMKLLDNLYKNYFEMHYIFYSSSNEITKCLKHSNECIKDYKTARQYCKNSNDNFYKVLMKFEQTYKSLYDEATQKNSSNGEYIKKLPTYYEIGGLSFYRDHEIISNIILYVSFIGSAIVIVLILIYIYMFTPFGARMRSRKRNNKRKFRNQNDNRESPLMYFDYSNNASFNSRKYNLAYNSA